jgi:predicted amidohydrolase YtcJ
MLYVIFVLSCFLFEKDKTTVDSIITDATIYTVNNSFDKATAMAISDGKILAIGTNDEITNKFKSDNTIDAKGKFMYPGLIDAHCHFTVMDLVCRKSIYEVLKVWTK